MKSTFSKLRTNILILALIIGGFWLYNTFFGLKQTPSSVPYKLKYVEKFFGDGNRRKPLPMVIAFHGTGGSEKNLINLLSVMDINFRVISFRGPFRHSPGYDWAPYVAGATREEIRKNYIAVFKDIGSSVADSVDELVHKYPTKGKPFILGFSMGARLTYYLAVNHPEHFKAAFALSGDLDPSLIPGHNDGNTYYPVIFAYHGINDSAIVVESARQTMNKIKKLTENAYYKEFPSRHSITSQMRIDIKRDLLRQISQL